MQSHVHPPLVDFSKAVHKSKSPFEKPDGKCYLHNNMYQTDVPEMNPSQPTSDITVKCNKVKHKLMVQNNWSGSELYKFLSYSVNIPFEKMKIIHKGKVLSTDIIQDTVRKGSVYQVIGEVAESEENIDQRDITVIMEQTGLDRNRAVLALKKKKDVIDALLDL